MAADVIWAQLRIDTKKAKTDVTTLGKEVRKTGKDSEKAGKAGAANFKRTGDAAAGATKKVRNLRKASKQTTTGFNSMGASLKSLAATMGVAFGVRQVINFAKEAVRAADLQARAEQKVKQAIESTRGAAKLSFDQLKQQASDLQQETIFGDEEILNRVTAQLLTFTNIAGDEFTRTQKVALDLATVLDGDLQSASIQLGKALNDPVANLSALSRAGIQFTKEQKAQVKQLVESGKLQEAQSLILDELERQYGGQAEAAAKAGAGGLKQFQNRMGDIQEEIGKELIPVLLELTDAFEVFVERDTSIEGIDKVGNAFDRLTTIIQFIPQPLNGLIRGVKDVRAAFKAFNDGDILGGFQSIAEGAANIVTMGVFGIVKDLTGANKELNESYEDFPVGKIEAINATSDELSEGLDVLAAETGVSREELAELANQLRQDELDKTFDDLSASLEITTEQFKELTDITDKYGISARVNASSILAIKDATEDQLNNAFLQFNETLGVTREDWEEYIGLVKDIPKLQQDVGKSTKKDMIGPYQELTKAVGDLNNKLLDQAALLSQNKLSFDATEESVINYIAAIDKLGKADEAFKILTSRSRELQDQINEAGIDVEIFAGKFSESILKVNEALRVILDIDLSLTADDIKRIDDAFNDLGLVGLTQYKTRIEELEELRQKELAATDGTLAKVVEINKRYADALQVIYAQQVADVSGALSNLAGTISESLSTLFGESAQKSAAFVAFQKILTLTEIGFSAAQAIASAIASIATGNPAQIISGIASIVGAITSVISGVQQAVQSTEIPSPPAFAEGTGYVQRGNNPPGIDTVPALLTEGEGVATVAANKKYPGLIDAINSGMGDQYMINFAERREALTQMEARREFSDYNLLRASGNQQNLTRETNFLLRKMLHKDSNPWNR